MTDRTIRWVSLFLIGLMVCGSVAGVASVALS